MLLWNDNDDEFLGLGLENGFLKVASNVLNFKDDQIDVLTGLYLTDGGWHNIKFEIDDKAQLSFMVDQKLVYNEAHSSDKIRNLDHLGDSFYLGKQASD